MTENGLLELVLERLGQADAKDAVFGADEVAEWPHGALNALVKAGLLRRTQPAQGIECTGCEENCIRPVHVLPAEGNRSVRAFISCNKRDDVGRVPVDMRRMEQWQTTGGLLARMLAQLFGFSQTAPSAADGRQWNIGVLKGRMHKSLVVLLAGDTLTLSLAGHVVPLMDVLTFKQNVLTLDKRDLARLVDKPEGKTETQEARQARLKARIREEKAKGTKAFLRTVANEEGIDVSRVKQIISGKPKSEPVPVPVPAPANSWSGLLTQTKQTSSKKTKPKY